MGDFVRNGPNLCSSEVGGGNLIGFAHWSSQHRDKHTARKTKHPFQNRFGNIFPSLNNHIIPQTFLFPMASSILLSYGKLNSS